jgi:hypothetical protein
MRRRNLVRYKNLIRGTPTWALRLTRLEMKGAEQPTQQRTSVSVAVYAAASFSQQSHLQYSGKGSQDYHLKVDSVA